MDFSASFGHGKLPSTGQNKSDGPPAGTDRTFQIKGSLLQDGVTSPIRNEERGPWPPVCTDSPEFQAQEKNVLEVHVREETLRGGYRVSQSSLVEGSLLPG